MDQLVRLAYGRDQRRWVIRCTAIAAMPPSTALAIGLPSIPPAPPCAATATATAHATKHPAEAAARATQRPPEAASRARCLAPVS